MFSVNMLQFLFQGTCSNVRKVNSCSDWMIVNIAVVDEVNEFYLYFCIKTWNMSALFIWSHRRLHSESFLQTFTAILSENILVNGELRDQSPLDITPGEDY